MLRLGNTLKAINDDRHRKYIPNNIYNKPSESVSIIKETRNISTQTSEISKNNVFM